MIRIVGLELWISGLGIRNTVYGHYPPSWRITCKRASDMKWKSFHAGVLGLRGVSISVFRYHMPHSTLSMRQFTITLAPTL